MVSQKLKYKLTTKGGFLKIFINEILHIAIKQVDIMGVQSWKEGSGYYVIRFYTKNRKITCEYDDIEKWSKILGLLNQNL